MYIVNSFMNPILKTLERVVGGKHCAELYAETIDKIVIYDLRCYKVCVPLVNLSEFRTLCAFTVNKLVDCQCMTIASKDENLIKFYYVKRYRVISNIFRQESE